MKLLNQDEAYFIINKLLLGHYSLYFHTMLCLVFQIPEMNVSINCVDIDPDASYLAAVNTKGTCFVWSISLGKTLEGIMQLHPRRKLDAHTKYGLKCKFSPDSV